MKIKHRKLVTVNLTGKVRKKSKRNKIESTIGINIDTIQYRKKRIA